MRKKILSLLCAGAMIASTLTGVVACGNGGDEEGVHPGCDIDVWVSEVDGVKTMTEEQIAKFITDNPKYANYNVTVEGISESESASTMITDVATGADVFCFAQDQMVRLVQAGALSKLGPGAAKNVADTHVASAVAAAKRGDDTYAYPLTADNGYFMYYDKNVVDESSLGSLDAIVEDLQGASKKMSFELEGSAWYNASFFIGAGCHSEFVLNDKGEISGIDDDYNSAKGLIAAKGMKKLLDSGVVVNSSNVADFNADSGVVISGTWAIKDVEKILGNNMGIAPLPSYTVDGKDYHLGWFSGNKLIGVKQHEDSKVQSFCQNLAVYLSSEACQLARFEKFGWGPSNKKAQENEKVKNAPQLQVLTAQAEYSVPEGQKHGSWWDIGKALASDIKNAANTDAGLQAALKTYQDSCAAIFTMSDEVKNAYTVIGSFNGSGWGTDFEMVQDPKGTWTSKDAFTLTEADKVEKDDENDGQPFYASFKVRKGKSWDIAWGNGTANYYITAPGTYKIQCVVTTDGDGNDTAGVVTLIPVTE